MAGRVEQSFQRAPPLVRERVKQRPWRGGLEPADPPPEGEVANVPAGNELPDALHGRSLTMCGPAALRVPTGRSSELCQDRYLGHWFDGFGAVSQVSVSPDGSSAATSWKLVESYRMQQQRKHAPAQKLITRCAWTQADNWLANARFPSNPINTSMTVFRNELLAVSEGGPPMKIDKHSLESLGTPTWPALSSLPTGFSAHMQYDKHTGDMFNFGVSSAPKLGITSFRLSHATGELIAKNDISTFQGQPLVHDCLQSENYIAWIIPPWYIPLSQLPLVVAGFRSFGHSFQWFENVGTRIVVQRKSDLHTVVDTFIDESISQYHHISAYEEEVDDGSGKLLLKLRTLVQQGSREELERQFTNMLDAFFTLQTANLAFELTIDLDSGTYLGRKPLVTTSEHMPSEFPQVNPYFATSSASNHVWTSFFGNSGFIDGIQRLDIKENEVHLHSFPEGVHAQEATFVPLERAHDDELDGILVFVAFNAAEHASELYVMDARTMACLSRVPLGTRLTYTFHNVLI